MFHGRKTREIRTYNMIVYGLLEGKRRLFVDCNSNPNLTLGERNVPTVDKSCCVYQSSKSDFSNFLDRKCLKRIKPWVSFTKFKTKMYWKNNCWSFYTNGTSILSFVIRGYLLTKYWRRDWLTYLNSTLSDIIMPCIIYSSLYSFWLFWEVNRLNSLSLLYIFVYVENGQKKI